MRTKGNPPWCVPPTIRTSHCSAGRAHGAERREGAPVGRGAERGRAAWRWLAGGSRRRSRRACARASSRRCTGAFARLASAWAPRRRWSTASARARARSSRSSTRWGSADPVGVGEAGARRPARARRAAPRGRRARDSRSLNGQDCATSLLGLGRRESSPALRARATRRASRAAPVARAAAVVASSLKAVDLANVVHGAGCLGLELAPAHARALGGAIARHAEHFSRTRSRRWSAFPRRARGGAAFGATKR